MSATHSVDEMRHSLDEMSGIERDIDSLLHLYELYRFFSLFISFLFLIRFEFFRRTTFEDESLATHSDPLSPLPPSSHSLIYPGFLSFLSFFSSMILK